MESVLLKDEKENVEFNKKKIMAVELLASIQPLRFFQRKAEHVLSIENILNLYASPGSSIWQQIIVSVDTCYVSMYTSFEAILISYRTSPPLIAFITVGYMRPCKIAESSVGVHRLD